MEDLLTAINIGEDANFATSDTKPEDIDAYFAYLEEKKAKKLMIYYHGGVVSKINGYETAGRMAEEFLDEKSGIYPLSFVWETGIGDIIRDEAAEIFKTKLFKNILKKALKIVGKKAGVEGKGAGGTMLTDDDIEQELKKKNPFDGFDFKRDPGSKGDDLIDAVEDEESLTKELEEDFGEELDKDPEGIENILNIPDERRYLDNATAQEDPGKGILSFALLIPRLAKAAFKIIRRLVKNRDHGFYPTVIEELLRALYLAKVGEWGWEVIKEKAVDIWKIQTGRDGAHRSVGGYFLAKLNAFVGHYPETAITLVGHSAGSIAISYMLDEIEKPYKNIKKIKNIIFLAPACRCKLFRDKIIAKKGKFETFTMFTMPDSLEKDDHLASIFYPRSLLYFISGVLEEESDEEILGMARHITGKKPYDKGMLKEVHGFLNGGKKGQVIYSSKQAIRGKLGSNSEGHMAFDNDESTLESIRKLL